MPTITLDISDAAAAKIQEATAEYNLLNGTDLTPKQWVFTVIKREALKLDLQNEITNIQLRAETESRKRIKDAEDALLGSLD